MCTAATQRLRQKKECGTRAVMTLHALEPDYFEDIRGYNGTLDAVIATNRLAQALVEQRSGLESRRVFYAPLWR